MVPGREQPVASQQHSAMISLLQKVHVINKELRIVETLLIRLWIDHEVFKRILEGKRHPR